MICHRVSSGCPHIHTHKPCHNKCLTDNGTSHQCIPPPTADPLNIPREGPRGLSTCGKICLEKLLFLAELLHLKPVWEAPHRASAWMQVGLVNKPAAWLMFFHRCEISRGTPATPEENNESYSHVYSPGKCPQTRLPSPLHIRPDSTSYTGREQREISAYSMSINYS